jgi:hypothetical protein
MAGSAAAEDTQITVKFSTKLPEQYRVPNDPVVSGAAQCGCAAAVNAVQALCKLYDAVEYACRPNAISSCIVTGLFK